MKFTESFLVLILAYEGMSSAQAAGLRRDRALQGPPGGNTYQSISDMLDVVFGSGPGPNGCQSQPVTPGSSSEYTCSDSSGSATLKGNGQGPNEQATHLHVCVSGSGPNNNKCHSLKFTSNDSNVDLDDSENLLVQYLLNVNYDKCQTTHGPPGPGGDSITCQNNGPGNQDTATYTISESNAPSGDDNQPKTLQVCNGSPGPTCQTLNFQEGQQVNNLQQAKDLIEG